MVMRKKDFTAGALNQRTRIFLARNFSSHSFAGNSGGCARIKFAALGSTRKPSLVSSRESESRVAMMRLKFAR